MNKYKLKIDNKEFICVTIYNKEQLDDLVKNGKKPMQIHTTEERKEIRIPRGVGEIEFIG